ncbi:SDR family NAD(P)-dependent oxidoreductase [Clostridium estertheticum]|uniref:SDR family NAD(P)-dependent oxidoreductase n=1 Tax=Clostridium estertheticum TaxID=238834 RepID=UPI0013EEC6F8|nr:SDR family NAD(P)-dependent oxidoreductase [Clostridium estertheticum]MBZ9609088.1 SDR family NAD(P)-dependent oxidoreductase [Clostridium estertheticum]
MENLSDMRLSTIMKNDNYIVRDHRVHGVRIMPGVTLLDMIYRFLKTKGINLKEVELKNVLFSEPVSTSEEYDKKIRVTFKEKGNGYNVVAKSQKVKDGVVLSDTWDENLRCDVHFTIMYNTKSIDIESIKNSSIRTEDMDYAYNYVRKIDINHREFMKVLGKLYYGEKRILAEISLGDLAHKYLDYFYMHPAYLDAATLVQGFVVLQTVDFSQNVKASIPMYIESFRSYEAMKEKIYVYIKEEGYENGSIKDLMYFDIEIYNEKGEEIASFKKWGLKKIRSKDTVSKLKNITNSNDHKEKPRAHLIKAKEVSLLKISSNNIEAIVTYLKNIVSEMADIDEEEIDTREGFYNQGLYSQDLLKIVTKLEERLETSLYPTLLFEYTNIDELSKYIFEEHKERFFARKEDTLVDLYVKNEIEDIKILGYAPYWKESTLKNNMKEELKNALVLCRDINDLQNIKGIELGKNNIFVFPAEKFKSEGNGIFKINLNNEDDFKKLVEELKVSDKIPNILIDSFNLHSEDENYKGINDQLDNSIYPMFYITRELIKSKLKSKIKVMYIYGLDKSTGNSNPKHQAMEGYLNCLRSENNKVIYKCICIDTKNKENIKDIIYKEAYGDWKDEDHLCYENKNRLVKRFRKIGNVDINSASVIKKGDVYLITGGAGGLGIKISEHILKNGGKVALIGRTSDVSDKIKLLQKEDDSIEYFACDITELEAVKKLYEKIKDKYGKVNGIIHCAGITRDSYIINKEIQEMKKVLSVKVDGTLILDEVFKAEKLDFFITFSSIAGVMGNPGQSDYAYANLFMDYYATVRESLRKEKSRYGKTLSINWPLWADGGMKSDSNTEELLKLKFGISLLDTKDGINALEWAMQTYESNIVILSGDEEKINSILLRDNEILEEKESTGERKNFKQEYRYDEDDDLAIIGVSGKYPGADNIFEYWNNLKTGKDSITVVDNGRWDYDKYKKIANEVWNRDCSKWGGFISDVDKFDSLLFNVAPYQAILMDPHERVFLEIAWETFEDSGLIKSTLKGEKVGVFVGAMWMQYQLYNNSRNISTTTISSIANRVSYYFGLNGPSMGIDTMCSSTMTAIHIACQSIKNKDCTMALVGGVNLSIHPDKYLLLTQGNFTSTDGRCRSFGEGGDGYVPSEAVGAILIKPLKEAEIDGDRIYAVIKSSAINHGGEASGFTVPNQKAQEEVVVEAIKRSNVDVETINYIEAHGTGTPLGDPIEVHALKKAFNRFTDKRRFCAIGSVKSNIGHAEAAAGISAITKVILQMKYKKLVPSINSEILNKNIHFEDSAFYVQNQLEEWTPVVKVFDGQKVVYPRRAGISSFGAGGSNAHIILEEYINSDYSKELSSRNYIFVLSAQTKERLNEYVKRMKVFFNKDKSVISKETEEIKDMIITSISTLLNIPEDSIGEDCNIYELGLSNVELVKLCEELNLVYDLDVNLSVVSKYSTVGDLSKYITTKVIGYVDNTCEVDDLDGINISSLTYTLQVSREPMKHRLAIITSSLGELVELLNKYLNDEVSDKVIIGKTDEISKGYEFYENGFNNCGDVAKAWVIGTEIKWKELYESNTPSIVSLPHYPFARKRYWIEAEDQIQFNTRNMISYEKGSNEKENSIEIKDLECDVVEEYTGNEVGLEIIDDNVAVIRIQDMDHNNTFTGGVIEGLTYNFHKVQSNKNIKVIVVTGSDRIFSMGGTQSQLMNISDSKLRFTDAPFLYRGMLECEIPVISAMQGHASGGGMLFGLYADIVVMAEESVYSAVFVKYGFTPGMGATFILEDKLGKNLATEMMFTAKTYTGEQLKNRAASVIFRKRDEVLIEAIAIARIIAEKPRNTVSVLKKELSIRVLDNLLRCIKREDEMHKLTFTTPEVKEKIKHYYRYSNDESANISAKKEKDKVQHSNDNVEIKDTVGAKSGDKDIKSKLIEILSKQIFMEAEDIDVEMNFKDMGVDSISGVEIVRDINKEFGTNLDTIDIYDNSTINDLSEYVKKKLNTVSYAEEVIDNIPEDSENDILDLLSKLNQDDLSIDEMAQFLEAYYE